MFLRYLIEIICILYMVRVVARWLLSSLFQSAINNAQQQQQGYRRQNYQQQERRQREGAIQIDHVPQKKKQQVPDSEGDFIDYEEIK